MVQVTLASRQAKRCDKYSSVPEDVTVCVHEWCATWLMSGALQLVIGFTLLGIGATMLLLVIGALLPQAPPFPMCFHFDVNGSPGSWTRLAVFGGCCRVNS